MTSIAIPDLLTVIYVLVDDWYQDNGVQLLKGKRGAKPEFSDSEVMTLMVAHDYIPYPSETQYVEWMRANHPKLFPQLLTQSQFNRRARGLRLLLEAFRRYIVTWLGAQAEVDFLLDSKPVPVMGYKRSKAHSQFAGSADYGVCPSRKMKYFGYKLVTLNTLDGLPVVCELVPANLDERTAAQAVVFQVRNSNILGDKGFIGEDWQAALYATTGNRVYTPKRTNQHVQNSPQFDRWLNNLRQRIEGAFHELQNTGRNLERLLAKTVVGLSTRVIGKLTSHAVRILLRRVFSIDVQTFSIAAP
jgi:uncharacterized short protein YbdD (DUF466 family)